MALNVSNVDAQLTNTVATILTATVPTQITILKATVVNTDTTNRTVSVYRVQAGSTSGAAGAGIIVGWTIAPSATVSLPLSGQSLISGEFLQAKASASGVVNLNIGYSYTP